MSNTNDYIITTLSSSIRQRTYETGVTTDPGAPLFLGVPNARTIRLTGAPYVSTLGNASSIFTREQISGSPGPTPPATQSLNLSFISASYMGGFSASLTPPPSYISPFIYADFETSSSTTVIVTGSQPTYSGTFATNGGKLPAYDGTNVFRGNYSLDFGNINGSGDTGWVSFGYAPDRPEWGNLFTGSFSVSTWVRPTEVASNWQYDGIFWFRARAPDSPTAYNWMLVLGKNTGGVTSDGSLGWYVSGTVDTWNWFPSASVPIVQNQWNHIVYAISGNISGDRSITAYINGNQLGTPYRSPVGQIPTGFSNKNNTGSNFQIGLGSWFDNNYNFKGQMDDLSVWDIELDSDQVNALYNGGSGVDVLTALTQSS